MKRVPLAIFTESRLFSTFSRAPGSLFWGSYLVTSGVRKTVFCAKMHVKTTLRQLASS